MPEIRVPGCYFPHLMIAATLVLPTNAAASCDLAAELATLHGAYSDVLNGSGTPRADIGRFVINRDLLDSSDRNFVEALRASGFYDDMDQLEPVFKDMAELAAGGADPLAETRHRENIIGLKDTLRNTGCFEDPADVPSTADDVAAAILTATSAPASAGSDQSQSQNARLLDRLAGLISDRAPASFYGLAGVGLTLGGAVLYTRRLMLRARARAYPRFPLGCPLMFGDIYGVRSWNTVVNISRGGLLIERPEMPSPGSLDRAIVSLVDGDHAVSLVWENAHFLAFEFHKPIEEETLQAVLSQIEPGAENKNSAPGGAADIEPDNGLAL